ncbi:MAG: hypothetical protein KJ726_03825, partial [Verrucomicrobia bacterium]|nr:hypothetical protein [Verrucomicrobiota bacterium]
RCRVASGGGIMVTPKWCHHRLGGGSSVTLLSVKNGRIITEPLQYWFLLELFPQGEFLSRKTDGGMDLFGLISWANQLPVM